MKPEDYPLVEFEGRRLRQVPELPGIDESTWARCTMCIACPTGERDRVLCQRTKNLTKTADGTHCSLGGVVTILVPEENFTEYVIEFVRRRVS